MIAVPRAEEPAQPVSRRDTSLYDELFDDSPTASKRVAQTAVGESDEFPPPRSAAYRPAKAKKRKAKTASGGDLPLLVKIGLMLIGGLLAAGGLGMLYIGITTGHSEVLWPAMAMILTCVFGGIAVVCNVKLMFMGYNCGYGGLPWYMPFRQLIWVLTNLSETGPLLLGNLAGLAALVIVWVPTIHHIKEAKAPKHIAAPPALAVRRDGFPVIVKGTPSNDAAHPVPVAIPEPDSLKKALADLKSSEPAKRKEAVAMLNRLNGVDLNQRDAVRERSSPCSMMRMVSWSSTWPGPWRSGQRPKPCRHSFPR